MYASSASKRGRGSSRFSNSAPSTPLPPDRDIMEGLRPKALQTLAIPTVTSSARAVAVTDLESIGSYNWTNAPSPTIVVPGSPPEWQNKAPPYQVPADTGIFFVDQNGFRMPPPIDTQLAGNTVLLNRWETRTRVAFSGFTYGFNFEKASTDPALGCENSTGHHASIWNGLKMVVRFEVDACIPTAAKPSAARGRVESIDDLADSLAGINIPNAPPRLPLPTFFSQTPHHFLAVHNRGRFSAVNKRKLTSSELRAVEQQIQPDLKKLRAALDLIKEIVVKHGQRGRLTLVYQDGTLQVFERVSSASCLPDEVMAKFEN
ncbi:hypothetical protein B0H13DRAFT_2531260 [Mycena leptocephala]|nr:hypothetical protein B0H13DRAFT_2531260 [Mycena leptocephala]